MFFLVHAAFEHELAAWLLRRPTAAHALAGALKAALGPCRAEVEGHRYARALLDPTPDLFLPT